MGNIGTNGCCTTVRVPSKFDGSLADVVDDRFRRPRVICCTGRGGGTVTAGVASGIIRAIRARMGRSFVAAVIGLVGRIFNFILSRGSVSNNTLFDGVARRVGRTGDTISSLGGSVSNFASVAGLAGRLNSSMGDRGLRGLLDNAGSIVGSAASIIGVARASISNIVSGVKALVGNVMAGLSGTTDVIRGFGPSRSSIRILGATTRAYAGVTAIVSAIYAVLGRVGSGLPSPVATVGSVVGALARGTTALHSLNTGLGSTTGNTCSNGLSSVTTSLESISTSVGTSASSFGSGIGPRTRGVISGLLGALSDTSGVVSLLSSSIPAVSSLVGTLGTSLSSNINVFNSLRSVLGGFRGRLSGLDRGVSALDGDSRFGAFLGIVDRGTSGLNRFVTYPMRIRASGVCNVSGCNSTVTPFCDALTV